LFRESKDEDSSSEESNHNTHKLKGGIKMQVKQNTQRNFFLDNNVEEINQFCTKKIEKDQKTKARLTRVRKKKGSQGTQNISNLTNMTNKEVLEYYVEMTGVDVPYATFSSAIQRGEFISRTFQALEKKLLKYFKEYGEKNSKENRDFLEANKYRKVQKSKNEFVLVRSSKSDPKKKSSTPKRLKKPEMKNVEKTLAESAIELLENSYEQELLKLKDYIEDKLKEIA
jgi:hypothetical protein